MLVPVSEAKIEDLGVQDEWVWDLETETHDFFANDILVHNSNYYTVEPIVNQWLRDHPGASFEEICDFCLEFEAKVIVPTIQKCIDDFAYQFNAPNPWAMAAKKEVLCDCVSPQTHIRWIEDGEIKFGKIGTLVNSVAGPDYNYKLPRAQVFDLSNRDIKVASLNETTGEVELKRVLNIQKKITTKPMVEVKFPGRAGIKCTEDHKFAVRTCTGIIWKEAKDLTEDDDVVVELCYSRRYANIWGVDYVNGSTLLNDEQRANRAAKISETKTSQRQKLKEEFNKRVQHLFTKYSGRWDKLIKLALRMCATSGKVERYLRQLPQADHIDIDLMVRLSRKNTRYRGVIIRRIRRARWYAKYRHTSSWHNYLIREGRAERKAHRARCRSDRYMYRKDVNRFTNRSIKELWPDGVANRGKHCHNNNVDHIVPVIAGYVMNIPPEIMGDKRNLRVVSKLSNLIKLHYVDMDLIDRTLFGDWINELESWNERCKGKAANKITEGL